MTILHMHDRLIVDCMRNIFAFIIKKKTKILTSRCLRTRGRFSKIGVNWDEKREMLTKVRRILEYIFPYNGHLKQESIKDPKISPIRRKETFIITSPR